VSDDIVILSDSTFDEAVGASDTPILVDFWAEWCGPCKMVAPTLAEIAGEQRGKLTVAKLNVDDNPDPPRLQGRRTGEAHRRREGQGRPPPGPGRVHHLTTRAALSAAPLRHPEPS